MAKAKEAFKHMKAAEAEQASLRAMDLGRELINMPIAGLLESALER